MNSPSDALDKRLNAYRDDLADARLKEQVSAARFVDGTPRQVIAPVAPLRRAPEPGTQTSSELLFGETVLLFEDRDGIAWVQNDTDGYVGYTDSVALSADVRRMTQRVKAIRTAIYPEPHVRAPAIDVLPMDARVAVTETKGRYAALATGGWVPADHLAGITDFEDDFVAVAERFMGSPYVWGGRSDRGLDCSALVQLALARCGVDSPRDSDMQETALGAPVAYDGDQTALKRGDFVFWKGHVGIWVTAERFLHANATDMCVSASPFPTVVDHILKVEKQPVSSVRRL